MITSTGLSDIVAEMRRYRFQVQELNPEDTVSGQPGFQGTRAGVTIRYDGDLFVDNEPIETPLGPFDITQHEMVVWFLNNFIAISNFASGHSDIDPSQAEYQPGEED